MKTKIQNLFIALALFAFINNVAAQGTAFTYQGRLFDGANAANGKYDVTLALFNQSSGGSQFGFTLTNAATVVTNGLFIVTLDFGGGIFNGTSYWLAIGVRTNGNGTFTPLSPRQPIIPTPYAIYAENAGTAVAANGVAAGSVTGGSIANATVTAGNIASGQVVKSLDGLYDAVTLAGGANISVTSVGNSITVASTVSGGGGGTNGWSLAGNAGTGSTNFLGTTDNQGLQLKVHGQLALLLEPSLIANAPNLVGGSSLNEVLGDGDTIAGGYKNGMLSNYGFIGGGVTNTIGLGSDYGSIGGGQGNTVAGEWDAIAGGYNNNVESGESSIVGGTGNLIDTNSNFSFNTLAFDTFSGGFSVVGGGFYNTISSGGSVIGGGFYNVIDTNSSSSSVNFFGQPFDGGFSVVGGGVTNTVSAGASFIGGGFNSIQPSAQWSVIGGGEGNVIDTNSYNPDVYIEEEGSHLENLSGGFSIIGGGVENEISSDTSFIGGGNDNLIDTNSSGSVIAGGWENYIVDSQWCAIGGGEANVHQDSYESFIGGGQGNSISAYNAAIAGGGGNTIDTNGNGAFIGGGFHNYANGDGVIPGGDNNVANGIDSFAAGIRAIATNDNTFVWNSGSEPFASTAPDQFLINAGAVAINTHPNPNTYYLIEHFDLTVPAISADYLNVGGNIEAGSIEATNGLSLFGGIYAYGSGEFAGDVSANSFSSTSDRNIKNHFAPVNAAEILDKVAALPITRWNFKADERTRHLGPMAQDFYSAFNIGTDDKHIGLLDEGGVALAAIQGLNQKLEQQDKDKDAEIQTLKQQNDSLAERLNELEAVVKSLAQQK
jgi:hypothetical protein